MPAEDQQLNRTDVFGKESTWGCGGSPAVRRKPVRRLPGERQRSRQPSNGLLAGKAAGAFPAGCFGPNWQAFPGGVAGVPPARRGSGRTSGRLQPWRSERGGDLPPLFKKRCRLKTLRRTEPGGAGPALQASSALLQPRRLSSDMTGKSRNEGLEPGHR